MAILTAIQAAVISAALVPGRYQLFVVGGQRAITVVGASGRPVRMRNVLLGGEETTWDVTKSIQNTKWDISMDSDNTYTFKNVGTGWYLSHDGVAQIGTEIIANSNAASKRKYRVVSIETNEYMYNILPFNNDDLNFGAVEAPGLVTFQPRSALYSRWLMVKVD